ncbi:MAG: branched-chain amino acid transport system substrate-binding protein [Actinomycetota bacterium]|nr:branched-chain amino acid transport system substrate-binding protein [Actinomycetota bacterium]
MSRRRPAHLVCALLALSLVGTACGLKPEQRDALKQSSTAAGAGTTGGAVAPGALGGTTGGTTGGALATTGGATGGTSGTFNGTTGGAPISGTGGGTTGGTSTGGTSGTTTGTAAAPTGGKCSTAGGDATGITKSTINIGIHAPQTGTGAPLPPSFKDGVATYWKDPAHKICGRTVVVDFQDDKYTPSTARDVCGPMSRRDFLVVGAAGTDQIQSCATMPDIAGKGVPYLSAGVTTNGLVGLNHYFATTLTYADQSSLVLRNAKAQGMGMKKWAVVTSRTDNFKDARNSMEAVLKQAGVPFVDIQVDATSDSGQQSRATQTGVQIASGGYDTVYVDTAPGYFLFMAQSASKQGFMGTYTGPGVTMTEVTVAQLTCGSTGGLIKANFLAPYPGIDRATNDFKKAYGPKYDDIKWSLWGLSQALEQILNSSSSLTRQGLIASMPHMSLPNGVYPPTKFNGGHFGGTGAFSQKLNCSETEPDGNNQPGQWDTIGPVLYK